MTIRADVNMGFYMRFVLIGLVVFGFGLWAVYDGFIGFPNQIVRAKKYHELSEEEDFETKWVDYAREHNWPLENPGEPKTQVDLYFNYFLVVVCIPLGLWLLISVMQARGRWIEADEQQLRSSWGQELNYDQITRLEKKQWKKKGIAHVHYEADGGIKKFLIDDFKFHRKPTDEILCLLESHIDPSIITGGPPEPPKEEE